MPFLRCVFGMLLILLASAPCGVADAQGPDELADLSGVIVDPSDARIPHANLHLHSSSLDFDATATATGSFNFTLQPGNYTLTVDAPGFRTLTCDPIVLGASGHRDLTLRLAIAARPEEISVDPWHGSTNPADNRNALTFTGSQLQLLSDDPTTLRQQLLALAGGAAGLGDAQFYVDGFSNGQLPPKSAIRSIRINNDPYSAEFDRAGFGRINIETRAGGQHLHGAFDAAGTDASFNSLNPYTGAQPPYHQLFFDGNLNGPLARKSTFFLAGNSTDLQNNAVVNAANPDAPATTLSEAVPNPQRDDDYSLRLDRQITPANSLNGRYEIHRTHLTNNGVGLLVLPSQGYTSNALVQTLQLDDNDVLSQKIVSDTRFQYIRTRLRQDPNDTSPAIVVEGAFSSGGAPTQTLRSNQDHYELQQDLSVDRGRHYIRTGARFRLYRSSSYSNAGFKGQFIFPNIAAYQSGNPSQFSLTAGNPSAAVSTVDLGVYVNDDWKLTRNFTLSLGLRYETQSAIPDHSDPAPRLGFSWAIGPKTARAPVLTLRGGAGLFYQRFDIANLLQAVSQNGTNQTEYLVQNPSFYSDYPNVPSPPSLPSNQATLYRVDPHLRTAYEFVTSITVERSFGKIGSLTANFLDAHGSHQYLSANINAPLPGTYSPADPASGTRPLGTDQNIYQYSSDGESDDRIFFSNLNLNPTRRLYVWGFYVAQQSNSDANSASTFAAHPYNPRLDYGREDNNYRQQLFCGFNATLPYGFSLQPFFNLHSGRPFNITTGTDLNGDTIYNDRPAFATDLTRPSVVHTSYGDFDTSPLPSQTVIPYNYGHAPGLVWVDLQASESFHIGPRPTLTAAANAPATAAMPAQPAPKADRPWQLTFKVEVQNLFNHDNPGPPVGVLTSPFFGRSLSLATDFGTALTAANRTVMLHSSFTF